MPISEVVHPCTPMRRPPLPSEHVEFGPHSDLIRLLRQQAVTACRNKSERGPLANWIRLPYSEWLLHSTCGPHSVSIRQNGILNAYGKPYLRRMPVSAQNTRMITCPMETFQRRGTNWYEAWCVFTERILKYLCLQVFQKVCITYDVMRITLIDWGIC